MEYNITINGFHGTNEEAATTIIDNQEYVYAYRDNHWLGQGIYFFSEDPDQAMSWALLQSNDNEKAVVLRTVIEVNSSSLLDLNTRTGIFSFNKMIKNFIKTMRENKLVVTSNDNDPNAKHKLRCLVMDSLPKNVKVIKKNFILDKQPHGLNRDFMERINVEMQSVQVCVRDNEVIKKETIQKYFEMEKRPKRYNPLKRKEKNKRRVNFK